MDFYTLHLKCLFFCLQLSQRKCFQKQPTHQKQIINRRSKLKPRANPVPPRSRGPASGPSAAGRLRLGRVPPLLALLCALVWCGGAAGRSGDGRGRGGGADAVGGADGAVLDGLVLRAARDGHVLALLVFVGDCGDKRRRDWRTCSGKLSRTPNQM